MYTDKRRERIEKEQDLRTQEFTIRSSQALIEQSEKKIAQITADYRRQLQTERVEVARAVEKLQPGAGEASRTARSCSSCARRRRASVKDLATHTAGTVAAPGTILMTLVPEGDKLVAEVWVSNQDVGFVRPAQDGEAQARRHSSSRSTA